MKPATSHTAARRQLPPRRPHTVVAFEHDGRRFVAGLGHFDDGELAEVFLNVEGRVGSDVAEHVQNVAILASMLLQVGVAPDAIRHSITGPIATLLALVAADFNPTNKETEHGNAN